MRPPFWTASVSSFDAYQGFLAFIGEELTRRYRYEGNIPPPGKDAFQLDGYCGVCDRPTRFHVDYQYAFGLPGGGRTPNWRERLVCEHCELNSRMRAALHLMKASLRADPDHQIYLTEEVTPFYKAVRARYPSAVGSEYLQDGTALGDRNRSGVLFQDITQLTFADATFDNLMSFDVLEHVPDYRRAMGEMLRVLRPGGRLMLTVPFDLNASATVERAYLGPDGRIVHRLEPEYHGDPLNSGGVLAFYNFGWDFLDDLRHAGFQDVSADFFWSEPYGYLGVIQFLITAARPSA